VACKPQNSGGTQHSRTDVVFVLESFQMFISSFLWRVKCAVVVLKER
jgi:hypothetical protein